MSATAPTSMPMLARGRHRNPRRGACFMELASYLAGESWSDAPACTDPALAHVARLVNDLTPDQSRPLLASLIPSVIGLRNLGPGFEDELALIAAVHALPIASQSRQRGLAVGVGRTLGEFGTYRTDASAQVRSRARHALGEMPALEQWAREFVDTMGSGRRGRPARSSASTITEMAVRGIADACVPDPEDRMRALLAEVIAHARGHVTGDREPPELLPHQWLGVVAAAR
ncbi:hypothetical protein [Ruania halotolerans]|uniref:hypothetical protein n=1 Tax=Ruania halotolerans TaxID=2897773 RepID=UPI001E52CAC4|nr:hypothetical protein [Ruania halotolerans]UFU06219.1 hypothetical protein LQF10_17615 [Ruania halotolerans]